MKIKIPKFKVKDLISLHYNNIVEELKVKDLISETLLSHKLKGIIKTKLTITYKKKSLTFQAIKARKIFVNKVHAALIEKVLK